MNDDSAIHYTSHGSTMLTGPDGMAFFRATVLASALKLYAKTGICPTRGVGPKNMMAHATAITGKTFKARDYLGAAAAVTEWAQTMKAALPKTLDGKEIIG